MGNSIRRYGVWIGIALVGAICWVGVFALGVWLGLQVLEIAVRALLSTRGPVLGVGAWVVYAVLRRRLRRW